MGSQRLIAGLAALLAAAVLAPAAQAQCVPTVEVCGDAAPPSADFGWSGDAAGEPTRFVSSSQPSGDRTIARQDWDLDGDGKLDAEGPEATTTYAEPGRYKVTLVVTDSAGKSSTAQKEVPIYRPQPRSVTLGANHTDLVWPNRVTLSGQVHPANATVESVTIRQAPLKDGTGPHGLPALEVKPDADGRFAITVRPTGNTRYVAELAYGRITSEPVDVYMQWLFRWGWDRVRGNLIEAGFVIRPIEAGAGVVGKLVYVYRHRRGWKWLRRVTTSRVRVSRTGRAFAYVRFRARRFGRRDGLFFCIRGDGSDNWGRPWGQANSRCGLRRLRY